MMVRTNKVYENIEQNHSYRKSQVYSYERKEYNGTWWNEVLFDMWSKTTKKYGIYTSRYIMIYVKLKVI